MPTPTGFDKGLGWKPDRPSFRDLKYSAGLHDKVDLALTPPPHAMVRGFRDPCMITDQRETSECTGHSSSKLWGLERRLTPRSQPFPYWHGRLIEEKRENNQATKYDNGAYIRDVIDGIRHEGIPRDDLWPDTDANVFTAPSQQAELDAEKRLPVQSLRIGDQGDIPTVQRQLVSSIASGHAFVTGVTCYDSFFSDRSIRTGLFLLPQPAEHDQGGHALICGEYWLNDAFRTTPFAQEMRQRGIPDSLFPRNVICAAGSWSKNYLLHGYHYFDMDYVANRNLADDTWGVRAR